MSIVPLSSRPVVAPRRPHHRWSALTDQALWFSLIGVIGTVAYVGLYLLLDAWWPALVGNAVAWMVTTVATNDAQRRLAFRTGGQLPHARDVAAGLLSSGGTLLLTTAVLAVLPDSDSDQVLAILAVNTVAGALRFLGMRHWFARARQARR